MKANCCWRCTYMVFSEGKGKCVCQYGDLFVGHVGYFELQHQKHNRILKKKNTCDEWQPRSKEETDALKATLKRDGKVYRQKMMIAK